MYTVHLTTYVANPNKEVKEGPDYCGNPIKVPVQENFIQIVADSYKKLKQGHTQFIKNGEVVAEIEQQYIVAIIDEG
jgi:hypothetical protein